MSAALDRLGLRDALAALPEQIAESAQVAAAVPLGPVGDRDVDRVAIVGSGVGGLAGDLVTAVAAPMVPVPLVVCRDYETPGFVDERTLVFALAHDGDTPETAEAAEQSVEAGASVVIVTGGGALAALAAQHDLPLVPVVGPAPVSRAALGSLAIPPLVVLERVGLFTGASVWVSDAVDVLAARRDELVADGSPAEQLARRLAGRFPLVYGGGPVGGVAAARWKQRMNADAKTPAFWGQLPDMRHHELAGWGQHGDITRQLLAMVLLRHDYEHPQVDAQFDLVVRYLEEVVHRYDVVRAHGDGPLAQLLDLVQYGDHVAVHLAQLIGIDPGPAPVLDELELAGRAAS